MLPRHPRSVLRVLASTAASILVLINAPLRLAADEVVEITDPYQGQRGHLKPLERLTTPVINEASDEASQALLRMKVPAGLKAELWAAEPMFANPVAFNLDEKGRVFVSETYRYGSSVLDIRDYMWILEDDLANRNQDDFTAMVHRLWGEDNVKELSKESERLTLLEDTKGAGKADKASTYATDFRSPIDGIASGVLTRRGDVWFSNIPALWKFTGKDKAETRTELLRGFGLRFNFTGHDFHGLVLGPDGRIYMSIGDRGAYVKTKEGGAVDSADTGAVFRCWPDGTGFELFATGLRNPQSLLFNEYGDLFTGDNDSDQGDQERLVHVVQDGDSGWRVGYQHAPRGNAGPWNAEKMWHPRNAAQPNFILPPICNIEDGPSGIAYYPGTGLTPAFAGTIFITHFKGSISNSGIYAYKVKPSGASYAIASAEPFLTGALPTDVRFGPDGKMYYSDWGEGWPKSKRGRIYTIFNPDYVKNPWVQRIKGAIASDFTKLTSIQLAGLLTNPDWRVRLEAQYTLAERGSEGIETFAKINSSIMFDAPSPDDLPAGQRPWVDYAVATRHAVWGLGMIARTHPAAISALRPFLKDPDDEVRAQAANTLGDLRDAASADNLVQALADNAPRVQFFAAQALGKLKYTPATPALLARVRANNNFDPYLRHALVMGLVGCATPAELVATAKDDSGAVRLAAVLALRRLHDAGVTAFLADTDRAIVREAVEAINDAPIVSAYPAIAAFVAKPVDDEPIMLRALNATFRLGGDEQAASLATFAANANSPTLRAEALTLLSLWPKPPARDRIVGIYRPLADKTRPTQAVAAALQPKLESILAAHTPDVVQVAAIDAVVALKLSSSLPILHATVADNAESPTVRVAALKALDGFNDAQLAATAALAVKSDVPELRLAALPITSRLAPAGALVNLTDLLARGTGKEQQTAFRALGGLKDPAVDDLLVAQLGRLAAGQIAPAAQLDLLDVAATRADPRIKKALADREAALAKDPDPLAPFRVALEGGDVRAGMKVFFGNPVMQCVRCHRVGDEPGGEAGPNLGGVATRGTREYILESIIKPSAKFAAGFEIVTVNRTSGTPVIGTLVKRDATGVQVKTSDATVDIAAADIKNVESAPSAMPELAALVLTKDEIRDLVAAVSTFRTPATAHDKVLRALQHLDGD